MKCSFCQKRIGIIKKLRRKYFRAIVKRLTPHGLLTYNNTIYFCDSNCIFNYEQSTGVRILQ